jgi:hypothetical protein
MVVDIASGLLADPRTPVRQIAHHLGTSDCDPLDVDDVDIGTIRRRNDATVIESDCGGGFRGQPLDDLLDRHVTRARFRPALQHEGRQARIAEQTAMSSAVA